MSTLYNQCGLSAQKTIAVASIAAEKDGLRDRGVWYYEAVKKSGWKGEIQLFEEKDEDHVYHLLKPALNQDSHKADALIKLMASFLVN